MRPSSLFRRGALAVLSSALPVIAAGVSFYTVGQLPGGKPNSQIRDAVLDGDRILAVGFATSNPASQLNPGGAGDTAVRWTLKEGLVPLRPMSRESCPRR